MRSAVASEPSSRCSVPMKLCCSRSASRNAASSTASARSSKGRSPTASAGSAVTSRAAARSVRSTPSRPSARGQPSASGSAYWATARCSGPIAVAWAPPARRFAAISTDRARSVKRLKVRPGGDQAGAPPWNPPLLGGLLADAHRRADLAPRLARWPRLVDEVADQVVGLIVGVGGEAERLREAQEGVVRRLLVRTRSMRWSRENGWVMRQFNLDAHLASSTN